MSLKRRDFLGNISKAGLLGTLTTVPGIIKAATSEVENLAPGFSALPYIQALTSNQVTIHWICNTPSYSWVEIKEEGAEPVKKHAITNGLVEANKRINKVTIHNLKPGTAYSYRVFSKHIEEFKPYQLTYGEELVSEEFHFKTYKESPEEVHWVVLNDIHDRPASFKVLMDLVKKPYDFVLLNGDMFDYQTDEQQFINHLLTPCTNAFAASVPFMFLRGNHETRGKFARNIHEYYSNINNGEYFAFQHGPVFIITLDTGEDKADDTDVYAGIVDFDSYREEQAVWLEEVLKSPQAVNAPFRVVMMHIPPIHSGDWHGPTHVNKLFHPLFNKYKVDAVISGHTHRKKFYDKDPGNMNYSLHIGGGPREGQRTFITVAASGTQLTIDIINEDGTVFNSKTSFRN